MPLLRPIIIDAVLSDNRVARGRDACIRQKLAAGVNPNDIRFRGEADMARSRAAR